MDIIMITPILQRRKLRHIKVKLFVQGYTVSKWQSSPKSMLLPTLMYCFSY